MSGGPYGRGKAPERACLNLAAWPEPDRALWLAALAPDDPFAERGATRSAHRYRTNLKIERSYGRWLTFLNRRDLLISTRNPAERITADVVRDYVHELDRLDNRKQTVLGRLQDLTEMAKVLAPDRDWTFIARIASKVRARTEPASDKRARLVGTDELVTLGIRFMDGATLEGTTLQSATAFRDGLIIALLALRPLRRGNLVHLTIGVDLVRSGSGWTIAIPPSETKTHAPLEFEWPVSLTAALDTYLLTHRPVLLKQRNRWHKAAGDRLWISSHGSPLTQMAVFDIVTKRTRAAFGRAINPHLFRDAAATTMAIHDPDKVRTAATLLAHRTFATTERHYIQAQSLHAHREFSDKMMALRSRLVADTESKT